ncbi:GspH/FimT family pseudopilin, partial [Polaromonas sp.]|uniref:GspH/FimT family protein n=1 Tax=Polaromonas sp. TaxID=1869339 RepID=UPI00286AEC20
SLNTYRRNAELTSATNTLLAAINAARSEALKLSTSAMVVPTGNGTDWNTGWVVFALGANNATRRYDENLDKTVLVQGRLPSYVIVTGNGTADPTTIAPYIMFDASGYATTKGEAGVTPNLTFNLTRNDVSGSEVFAQTRRIKISRTGRARTCKPTSATDTNCSATVND